MQLRQLPIFICSFLVFWSPLQATTIPLDLNNGSWQSLNYKNIPANKLTQLKNSIQLSIQGSASPLIYVLNDPLLVKDINVTGSITDLPVIPDGLSQGDENADDFPFRIGLVLSGDKTLGFAEKLIAPKWVKTLFKLAPDGSGIDHIQFLNLANPKQLEWTMRDHPGGKGLFKEVIVGHINPNEAFELNYSLVRASEIVALWISSDGDDTNSHYTLTINSITLN